MPTAAAVFLVGATPDLQQIPRFFGSGPGPRLGWKPGQAEAWSIMEIETLPPSKEISLRCGPWAHGAPPIKVPGGWGFVLFPVPPLSPPRGAEGTRGVCGAPPKRTGP